MSMDNNTLNNIVYPSDSFSDRQNVTLAIVPKISGLLSLIGSLCIITSILSPKRNQNVERRINRNPDRNRTVKRVRRVRTRRRKRRARGQRSNVQKRLFLGLSFCDIIQSSCYIASTWPIPKHIIYDNIKFNIGNQTSCNIQGFLILYGAMSVPLYNAFLCVYYYICVKVKNLSQKRIAKRIEPFFHITALALPLNFCIYGLLNNMFNATSAACFLVPYPRRCVDEEFDIDCVRGEDSLKLRRVCIGVILLCFIIMIVSLTLLYKLVRKQEIRMDRYSFSKSQSIENGWDTHEVSDEDAMDGDSNLEREDKQGNRRRKYSSYISSSMSSATSSIMSHFSRQSTSPTRTRSGDRVLKQSMCYVIPFIIVWCPTIIQLTLLPRVKDPRVAYFCQISLTLCAPLQVSRKQDSSTLLNPFFHDFTIIYCVHDYFLNRINYFCSLCTRVFSTR